MAETKVGRPGKRVVERKDGSLRTFTKEQLDKHLDEAIIFMASKGKTKYDQETQDSVKTQGEEQRQHEAICLHDRTIADLLQIKALGGVIEVPDNK